MTVARVHHAGTVRECLVERMLGGRHGRVPAVITPALGDHPGMFGKPLREFDRPLHKLRLALPHVHEQVGRPPEGSMEEMQMSVVKAGADEGIAVIEHGSRCGTRGDHILQGARRHDPLPRHGERQGPGGALRRGARKHACGRDDVIDLGEFHVSLLTAVCSHLAEIVRRAPEKLKVYVFGEGFNSNHVERPLLALRDLGFCCRIAAHNAVIRSKRSPKRTLCGKGPPDTALNRRKPSIERKRHVDSGETPNEPKALTYG